MVQINRYVNQIVGRNSTMFFDMDGLFNYFGWRRINEDWEENRYRGPDADIPIFTGKSYTTLNQIYGRIIRRI